jgi:hypothetical protein
VARVLDYGGLAFEDDRPNTLAEALASLEKGIRAWYEEQGIEVQDFNRPTVLSCQSGVSPKEELKTGRTLGCSPPTVPVMLSRTP